MNRRLHVAVYLVAHFFTSTVTAEDFCVSSTAEIQQALTTAGNNGESDRIRIISGTYNVPSGPSIDSGFLYGAGDQDSEFFDLEISGGWYRNSNNQCIQQINSSPFQTVLDGENKHRILQIYPSNATNISITGIHFTNGFLDQFRGGVAVFISNAVLQEPYTGRILIERNAFTSNDGESGTLYLATAGTTEVRNNLFAFNKTFDNFAGAFTYAAVESPQTRLFFTNNTVVANTTKSSFNQAVSGVGIFINGDHDSLIVLVNNILWENQTNDFRVSGMNGINGAAVIMSLVSNDIGSMYTFDPLDVDLDNISIDPVFQTTGGLNYSLAQNSPLINQGYNSPGSAEWYMGDFDILGKPRVYNDTTVDIGAFEFFPDVLFKNGFE
ncbi:choice-of-anchor Q domain-containing protein [Marinicella sp. W31]|uniref:choice-of-anchor Q domain-containing protein n=1 Tax=Marinicella sp. W31 TaxID=3023713 RepID=UPI0037583927